MTPMRAVGIFVLGYFFLVSLPFVGALLSITLVVCVFSTIGFFVMIAAKSPREKSPDPRPPHPG